MIDVYTYSRGIAGSKTISYERIYLVVNYSICQKVVKNIPGSIESYLIHMLKF